MKTKPHYRYLICLCQTALLAGLVVPLVAHAQTPPACVAPPAGLVSWWRGEGNAQDQQARAPGTEQGGASYVPGKVGQAFRFNGSSGLVTLGNNSSFRQSSAITYSFWVRLPSSAGGSAGGYAMGTAATGGHGYGGVSLGASGIYFAWTPLDPGSDTWIYSDGVTLPTDEWIHLTVCVDFDAKTRAMYVNGQAANTTLSQTPSDWHPKTGFNDNAQPDSIGGRFVNEWNYFNGDLDEVDVYSRALTASEVQAIYTAGTAGKCVPCAPPPSGLVGWWRGENNALDTANGNAGTLQGGMGFAPGKVGMGFIFDGVDDYVAFPEEVVFGDLATFGVWIKTTQAGGAIVDGGAGPNPAQFQSWRLSLDAQGRPQFDHSRNGVNGYASITGPSAVNDGLFHYLAVTTDQATKTIKLYVDGIEVSTYTENDPSFLSWGYCDAGAQKFGKGDAFGLPAISHFAGILDEPELYDHPLTANEIAAIYQAGAAGKCLTGTPPTITCPANITRQTDNPAGTAVTFAPTTSGGSGTVTVACTPASGSVFPVGTTMVTCTATDMANQTATCSFTVTVSLSGSCLNPPPGLMGWWRAENNAQDLVGTSHGALIGDAAFTPGKVGTAFHFDGNGDYVQIPASPAVEPRQAITIEGWVFAENSVPGQAGIAGNWDDVNGSYRAVLFWLSADRLQLIISPDGGGYNAASDPNPLPIGEWVHVAGTHDGNTIRVYRNGELVGSTAFAGGIAAFGRPFLIGRTLGGSEGPDDWRGSIDELSLYNVALSTEQIRSIYQAGAAGKCAVPQLTITCPANITRQTDNPAGTAVTFAPTTSGGSGTVTVVCTPASGSVFPVGTTTVNCTATDSANQTAMCSFTVTVNYLPPGPTITCPANITEQTTSAAGKTVSFATPTASSPNGNVTVICAPTSGSTFSVGTTTVNCTATDTANQTAMCSFTVTVNYSPPGPTITCPANITQQTDNPAGTAVTFAPTTSGGSGTVTVVCTPASGSVFPVGTTTVNCTATDTANQTAMCSFTVTVNYSPPGPTITCPANITRQTDDPAGTAVTFAPTTSGGSGTVTVVCTPASDSVFSVGTTMVNCTATDAAQQTAMCSFMVTVNYSPAETCPPTEAIAWYRAEDNAQDSIGGHDGLLGGEPPYFGGGHFGGQSFWTRGGDSIGTTARSVYVPGTDPLTALDFSGSSFTWEVWALPNWVDGDPIVMEQGGDFSTELGYPNSGIRIRLFQDIRDNFYRFARVAAYIDSSNPSVVSDPGAVGSLQWNHIVFVLDHAANRARLYVNGTLVGSAEEARTPAPSFFRDLMIGGPLLANPAFGFNGFLDEVVLYKRALTPQEIRARYTCGQNIACPPPSNGLVSWWRGENNTLDQLGNNDGTPVVTPPLPLTYFSGHSERAFDFADGHFVQAQRQVENDFTLAAWMRSIAPPRNGSQFWEGDGFIYCGAPGANYDFGTAILNGKFAFGIGQPGQPDQTIQSITTVRSGEWTHVAAVRSGTVIKVYVNGVEEASLDTGISAPLNAQPLLYLGGNVADNRFYTGLMDEGMVYGRALTAAEILGLYQCTTTVPPTITCPANVVEQSLSTDGKVVSFPTPTTSGGNGSVTVVCTPPSGSVFPIGTTMVNCTATDTANQTATCSFTVTVNYTGGPVVFSDGAFEDSEWELIILNMNNPGTVVASHVAAGGNPDAYRRGMNTVGSGTPTDPSRVVGFHRKIGATYQPQSQGALGTIDYSEDSLLEVGGGNGQRTGPALRQGGNVYVHLSLLTPETVWTHKTRNGLRAEDFVLVDPSATTDTGFFDATRRPDFSASGGLIEIGFYRANSAVAGGNGYSTTASIDNWSMTLRPATLAINPSSISVAPNGTVNFSATGGSGTLTYSIHQNNSGGTINASTGEYRAGNQCGVTDTIRVTDANNETADATVTIVDTVPPVITACAPPRTLPTGANCQAALPDLIGEVTATDACGTPIITQTPAAGTLLAPGTHTVTLRATDAAGNASTCDVIVTVADTTAPVITTCAPAQTLSAGANCQTALPDLTGLVTATDNCGAPTIGQSPPAGTSVGVGVHTIMLSATDVAGNVSSCTAQITVTESTPPTITCPGDVTTEVLEPGGTVVAFAVMATDNCTAAPTIVCVPASGSVFPLGDTPVVCTATDASGNTANCSFNVRVNLSADSSYAYFTSFERGIGPEWSVPRIVSVPEFTQFSGRFGNEVQTLTVDSLVAGNRYTLEFDLYLLDSWDGNSSEFGPDYFNVAIDGAQVFHETFANSNGEPPTETQTFPGSPEGGRRHLGFNPNFVDAIYRSIRISFVASGPSAVFTFFGEGLQALSDESWGIDNVGVRKSVTLSPASTTVDTGGTVNFTALFGRPPYTWSIVNAPANGTIDGSSGVYHANIGCGGTDIILVTDAYGDTAQATVQIADTTAPTYSCGPGRVLQSTSPNGRTVQFLEGVFDDACGGLVTVTCEPHSGSIFPIGTTTVNCTATDPAGNATRCSFTLTIDYFDAPPEIIGCAPNRTVEMGNKCQAALPDLTGQVTVKDFGIPLSVPYTISQTPSAGVLISPGAHVVTITVRDELGRQAICSATVTVIDTTPPTITCPPDQIINAGVNGIATLPNYRRLVRWMDACAVTVSQNPAANTPLAVGTHPVTFTATDAAGNVSTCAITVRVRPRTFVISGRVINSASTPLAGVKMNLIKVHKWGTTLLTQFTDSSGNYSFGVAPETTLVVYPDPRDVAWSTPWVRSVESISGDVQCNFTVRLKSKALIQDEASASDRAKGNTEPEPQIPLIAGLVLDTNGVPLIGAPISLSGDSNQTTNTSAFGDFLFEALPTNGNFNVVCTATGRIFSPAVATITNLSEGEFIVFVEQPLTPFPRPVLSIQPDARFDGQLVVTWPGNALDFILEFTPSLSDPVWDRTDEQQWQDVDGVVVPLAPPTDVRFFRLRNP